LLAALEWEDYNYAVYPIILHVHGLSYSKYILHVYMFVFVPELIENMQD